MRTLGFGAACWLLLCTGSVFAETELDTPYASVVVDFAGAEDFSGGAVQHDDCCKCASGGWLTPLKDGQGLDVYGWINGGYIWNRDNPNSKFNGPYNAVDRANEAMLNQAYLAVEKHLPACGCGVGGRFDVFYGEDYLLAESIGMEKRPDGSARWNSEYYGVAIPQAYVNIGNQDLSLQVGHFYTIMGYEGVPAPNNFFYSMSYSYQFAGPFTHWGGQVNWNLNEAWQVQLGLHNGWDALDRVEDSVGVIGKVKYTNCATGAWTSFAITTGDDYSNLAGLAVQEDFTNRTRYSWIVSLPITCRLEYVFHHWLGLQKDGTVNGTQADWYGIDQYVYYTINDCWKAGLRFEWFRDHDGTRVGLNRVSNPNKPPFAGNFYSLSAGVNWTPTENFILRPEVRADWYNGDAATAPFDDGNRDSQLMLGFDAILLF